MRRTIFALFDDAVGALLAAGALEREGYSRDRISLLVPDPLGRYARVAENGGGSGPERGASLAREFHPAAFEGLGPLAVAGPLEAALDGERRPEPVEFLTALGFAEPAARHYFESLRRNQALLAVEPPEGGTRRAVEVIRGLGARAVDETRSNGARAAREQKARRPDVAAQPPSAPEARPVVPEARPAAAVAAPGAESLPVQVAVPVVEELLEIGKRQVLRGGVRIHSHIVEEPVERSVSLREEQLRIERRPVSRDATEEDLAGFKEGSIEIHETIEEPVIVKRRRVVEEVVIGKETRERVQTISDTVRKTEVSVERLPGSGDAEAEPARAAERFGEELARDERSGHADWDAIEPQARRDWEERNPGTWEQIEDAVRTAWQKVRGR